MKVMIGLLCVSDEVWCLCVCIELSDLINSRYIINVYDIYAWRVLQRCPLSDIIFWEYTSLTQIFIVSLCLYNFINRVSARNIPSDIIDW